MVFDCADIGNGSLANEFETVGLLYVLVVLFFNGACFNVAAPDLSNDGEIHHVVPD